MSYDNDASKALLNVADSLQAAIDDKNAKINVFTAKQKMPIVNQFVLLFYQSFLSTIDEYKLSRNEIRTILKILEYAQFGNLIQMSNSAIANDLNINKSNMSRIMKKLKESGLLIDDNGNVYLNPQIIAKGNFLKREVEEYENLLNIGAKTLYDKTGGSPNIITPKLRKEIQRKTHNSIKEKQLDLMQDD